MLFVRFIDMWNEHFDGLVRPHRAFTDMGSFLNNDQFAVLHNILSVVGVFSITLYSGNIFGAAIISMCSVCPFSNLVVVVCNARLYLQLMAVPG